MSKNHVFFIAVVVVVAFVVFASNSPNHAQNKLDAKAPRVEYKVVRFSSSDERNLTKQLNEIAKEGWRYAFVVTEESYETGNKKPDKFTRATRTRTYIAFQRSAKQAVEVQ